MLETKGRPWGRHKFQRLSHKYPVVRGMVSYALTWPCCSLVQEYIEFGVPLSEADWLRAARFSFFGAFFMSPLFYSWMKFTQPFFRKRSFRTCVKRAAIEQVTYGPFALSYFLFGMSLLEMKSFKECLEEVRTKFWRTYTVGFVYWPAAQTINYCMVPARNRMHFVSGASFVWTVYMAHVMAHKHQQEEESGEVKSTTS